MAYTTLDTYLAQNRKKKRKKNVVAKKRKTNKPYPSTPDATLAQGKKKRQLAKSMRRAKSKTRYGGITRKLGSRGKVIAEMKKVQRRLAELRKEQDAYKK